MCDIPVYTSFLNKFENNSIAGRVSWRSVEVPYSMKGKCAATSRKLLVSATVPNSSLQGPVVPNYTQKIERDITFFYCCCRVGIENSCTFLLQLPYSDYSNFPITGDVSYEARKHTVDVRK